MDTGNPKAESVWEGYHEESRTKKENTGNPAEQQQPGDGGSASQGSGCFPPGHCAGYGSPAECRYGHRFHPERLPDQRPEPDHGF